MPLAGQRTSPEITTQSKLFRRPVQFSLGTKKAALRVGPWIEPHKDFRALDGVMPAITKGIAQRLKQVQGSLVA